MFKPDQSAFHELGRIVSENSSPLLAWVGAGLSRPAGLPTWAGLRQVLTDELEQKIAALDEVARAQPSGKLRAARDQDNPWVAFRLLRDGLDRTSYQAAIRNALRAASTTPPPRAYAGLWKLRLSGLLNLNLDQFATRAYSEVHGGRQLTVFHGRDAARYAHVLQTPTSAFAANLHGTTDDVGSWVFTDEDLRHLTDVSGYREFINACVMTRTIIFVGISAEDGAAGGHLARLRAGGIDFASHYWITDRRDAETDAWAEKAGVRLIRYSNQDGTHQELGQCIDALLRLSADDDYVRPVVSGPASPPGSALPPPDELIRTQDAEAIRQALNAEARRILEDESPAGYAAYEAFCLEYDQAIHSAWYIPQDLARRPTRLMGHRLLKAIATGGFGTVYEAESPAGETFAVKLLHEAVRNDPEHLQSFRRGVRSMRLLTKAKADGVVRYHDASEIPAFAVMEHVPGPTLHEAVQRRPLTWSDNLRIGVRLARILQASHRLPERILHRDFRPKNVMFRESWDGDDDWDLVVLDFDLSWHKDSQEKSMTLESYSGYLAPEQVQRDSKYSTRNALVDSYGLGMTLYYLRARQEPTFAQAGQADWDAHLQALAGRHTCKEWVSLPRRYSRLILNSTWIEQPRRWDVTQIGDELTRLRDALAKPGGVRSAELLAEEVGAQAFPDTYRWDPDRYAAVHQITNEARLSIAGDESARAVELALAWTDPGHHHWAQTKKWGEDLLAKAVPLLTKAGWSVRSKRVTNREMSLEATVATEVLARQIGAGAAAVAKLNELLIRH